MSFEKFEKVNPSHPDKVADRIAGAIVDLAYKNNNFPKVAVEVMIGHGECFVIVETTEDLKEKDIKNIIDRISPDKVDSKIRVYPQDSHLTNNQKGQVRTGDNGIFKGLPITKTERELSTFAKELYRDFPTDGKHILDTSKGGRAVICQSHFNTKINWKRVDELLDHLSLKEININPLGDWIGGSSVDVGCTNRKLGSDMAQAVTGGGLHGKDLSKADVTLNIYAHLKAQETKQEELITCAIGDEFVDGKPYAELVEIAREYINNLGGFEKFAEWGLV